MAARPGHIAAVLAALAVACPAQAAGPGGTFGVVSDIHFDPFEPPHLAGRLAAAEPGEWEAIFAALDGQAAASYGADTNYALLRSALGAISQRMAAVDFLVVTGDLLAHRFEADARALGVDPAAFAARTTVFVAQALGKALPGKPVILALGNEDSACGDYRVEPGGSYLGATAAAIRALLGEALDADFEATYRAGGYYALRHPTVEDAIVIVLNDTLWSPRYRDTCAGAKTDAPQAMLAWLEARLAQARAEGRGVWIVRHIPAGIDAYASLHAPAGSCREQVVPLLREPFATRLAALLRDHAGPVRAILSGHTHRDSYRLTMAADGSPLDVEKVVPAISPIYGQNPGFQVFAYDTASGAPTDFETWYLPDPGSASLAAPGTWEREYAFTEAYGQPAFSAEAVAAMWAAARAGGPAREAFARHYAVDRGMPDEEALSAFLCAVRYQDAAGFADCRCGG